MANVALNKYAEASNSIFPYLPAKAVDGLQTPLNRWVGSAPVPPSGTPAPVWLSIDLGAFYWINRWVVKHMGAVGWPEPPSTELYNLLDYKLQGSLDNVNWFDIDSVTNNSAKQTDRTTAPTKVRWARVYVTKGLRCNNNFASIVELELYNADPTSAKLSGLTISNNGTLNPPFGSTTYSYSANVGYDASSITLTPTAEDSRATIKVNGTPVVSGQPSAPVSLNVGTNPPITVEVTPFIGEPQNYVITVTRASSPYLSGLVVKAGRNPLTLTPAFVSTTLSYTANSLGAASITITPTLETPTIDGGNAVIKVNGIVVVSGQPSGIINLNPGSNPQSVEVTSALGGDVKTYSINVTR